MPNDSSQVPANVNQSVPHRVYIGVDIGGTNLRSALVDDSGNILEIKKNQIRIDLGTRAAFERLAAQCLELSQSARRAGLEVEAVGLGVAGKIDRAAGKVLFSPNLPAMDGFPLGEELSERTGLPVFMENDAKAFCVGESVAGAAKGLDNWVGITLGTGTGGCLFLGGRLWEGEGLGFCAEIGHMIVEPGGPLCACGSRGCLETFASARAIVHGAKALIAEGTVNGGPLADLSAAGDISSESVYRCAAAGDARALSLFQKAGWALGIAFANLFSILGIRRGIVGGGVSAAWDLFIGPLRQSLAQNISMLDPQRAKIMRSTLGDRAALIGAAKMAEKRACKACARCLPAPVSRLAARRE